MTPNGALFRTDKKGFLPQLMEDMYNTRTEYKKKMLEAKQEYENTKDKKLLKDISRYNNIQMAKRFHSTLLMVQSVMHTLGITIYSLLKGLLQVVSYLFAGLSLLLIGISIRFVELLKKISFLRLIPTRCTLHLTDLLIVC